MANRLTDKELKRVVAEVERIAQAKEAELSQAEVEDVLKELGLPSELLDDAITQLRRQDALAVQTRERRVMVAGAVVVGTIAIAMFLFGQQQERQALNRLGAVTDQVTLERDGNPITIVQRQENPELFYQVTLTQSPLGRRLPLSCHWISPSGQVLHQNKYRTQPIETSVWKTHCRYRVPAAAEPGTWTVEMTLGNRVLESQTFQVD